MLTGLMYVCVVGGTVNGVFIYRTQKGKWLCEFVRTSCTILCRRQSWPDFEPKTVPNAQHGTCRSL